jgi:uncharacterized membrane protein YhaH (DUF805 family)
MSSRLRRRWPERHSSRIARPFSQTWGSSTRRPRCPVGPGSNQSSDPPEGNPLIGYWKLNVLERYAKFDGRARRAEYWWFWLANLIVLIGLSILGRITAVFLILYFVYAVALIVPSLAVAVRRLHDTDKSGWFLLIALIPCVGSIIVIVFLATDSTRGSNQYGVSEKYPTG